MEKFFYIVLFAIMSLFPVYALELVPTPKQVKASGCNVMLGPEWKISGKSPAAEYLRTTLSQECQWNETPDAGTVVAFSKLDNPIQEAYRLRITARRIELSAASDAGFYRAAGRLAGIIALNGVKTATNALMLPELEITDYPDFTVRALMLQMPFKENMSDSNRYTMIERSIEAAARLGYNMIILDVGGSFNSTHNKSIRPHGWAATELRQLVNYCRKRGLVAIPGINTIGHINRAPYIFPIKNEKGKDIGMDIRKPEFFDQYEAVLDDLLEIFDHPPYFHIGADESREVFKKLAASPEEGARLFASTINRIQAYLAKKHCKTIIWHDMLFDQKDLPRQEGSDRMQGREPANGEMTSGARTKLTKDIIVAYWCYHFRTAYRGINLLQKDGFQIWVAPWNNRPNIESLLQYAAKRGIKKVIATLWNSSYKEGAAIVMTGAKAWNLKAPLPDRADRLFFRLYAQDLTRIPEAAKSMAFHDTQPPHAVVEITPVKNPDELMTLMGKNPGSAILVRMPEVAAEGQVIRNINVRRGVGTVVLYTPNFGQTTRTNPWGNSYAWDNGRITVIDYFTSNVKIPYRGAVISMHASAKTPGLWLGNHLTLHRKVELAAISLKDSVQKKVITASLPADTRGILVQLGVDHALYGCTAYNCNAATLSIIFADGSKDELPLNNKCTVLPSLYCKGKFSTAPVDTSRIWIRWDNTGDKKVKSLELEIGRCGLLENLKAYSGVSW